MHSTHPISARTRAARPPALVWLAVLASLAPLTLAPAPAAAQPPVLDVTEELDFEDPESWAMAYFSSVALLTGFGPPERLAPGAVELGLEGGWVPSLSERQRRVGFGGTKVEDLNRTDVFGRVRATVGLPGGFSATAAWVPPVELDDVETELYSLAIGRPLWEGSRWRTGWRLHGQTGTVEGPITCTAGDVAGGNDPEANPFGCQAPSNDEATLTYYGVELSAARVTRSGFEPYLAASLNRFDNEFQVDALVFSIRDRTLLLSEGETWSLAAGGILPLGTRGRLAGEVLYTPLDVVRLDDDFEPLPEETDELVNARVMFTWRLR